MKSALPCVLTINGGSSSIRFAVYEVGKNPCRRLAGKIDRIGLSGTNLIVNDLVGKPQIPRRLTATDHRTAVEFLLDWLEAQPIFARVFIYLTQFFSSKVVFFKFYLKDET
jgi:acetate kinase